MLIKEDLSLWWMMMPPAATDQNCNFANRNVHFHFLNVTTWRRRDRSGAQEEPTAAEKRN